ncbi:MAG: hypothetical protein ACO393_04100 [Methylophilaceae bacterium]
MRKKKSPSPKSYQALNFDDFKWCLDNDFQVYIVPLAVEKSVDLLDDEGKVYKKIFWESTGMYKIGVRRRGISSNGMDEIRINGTTFKSKEKLSELTFNNMTEAHNHMNYVYKYLRNKYG